MSKKLKAGLLCNNKMAMPAMQRMVQAGVLSAVATTDKDREVMSMYGQAAQATNIPYREITYKDYAGQLREWVATHDLDVVFVMTFAWRIPEDVLQLPPMGFVNFHYGLLPEMRGADPIFESIRQQKQKAGVTVHIMDAGFDTGSILLRQEMPLAPEYTYGMLCGQMARMGEQLCGQLLAQLGEGRLPAATPQDETAMSYWPKIKRETIAINWKDMNRAEIIALVRACNPIGRGVPVTLNGWQLGVCDVSEINLAGNTNGIMPGTIVALDVQNGLVVCSRDGKGVKVDVIITGEGIFPGYKLNLWGITAGMVFG